MIYNFGKILSFFVLTAVLFSCAGIPHDITSGRELNEPFGFNHAGSRGDEETALLKTLGAHWVRLDISWVKMQAEPGNFDYSAYDALLEKTDAEGVSVLGILDYDVPWIHEKPEGKRQVNPEQLSYWLEYVQAVALRYGDSLAALEIWNEPNFGKFWTGSDEDFFLLTSQTVSLLNRLLPNTPIIVGSLMYNPFVGGPGYLKKLLASGAADGADAVSLHPYGISPKAGARRMAKAGELMKDYGFQGELWITEMGYPTGGSYPHAVSEELQGVYIAKSISSSFAAGVDRIIWYQLYDRYLPGEAPDRTSSEAFFGVAYPDYSLKTGGAVIARMAPILNRSFWAPELLSDNPPANIPAIIYPFRDTEGNITVVAWSGLGRMNVELRGFRDGAVIYETKTGKESTWHPGDSVPLSPEPLIITGMSEGGIEFR